MQVLGRGAEQSPGGTELWRLNWQLLFVSCVVCAPHSQPGAAFGGSAQGALSPALPAENHRIMEYPELEGPTGVIESSLARDCGLAGAQPCSASPASPNPGMEIPYPKHPFAFCSWTLYSLATAHRDFPPPHVCSDR